MKTTLYAVPNSSYDRALVLGGGGAAGNAWLIGVIAGLAETGLDVTDADLIIGTSAGSTAAAQLTSATAAALLAEILAAASQHPTGPRAVRGPVPGRSAAHHMARTSAIIAAAADAADMRRRLGAAAIEMTTESNASAQERWRDTVAARLPSHLWPHQRMLITAVDADTGEPMVFDRDTGIELVDAVAASCSSGAAYPIGRKRYIDGGYRSNADNADLAAGYARVLVLSPFSGRSRTPAEWGMQLATQVDRLRADGSRVETIFPDSGSASLFGANALDPSLRLPAARAGHDQGTALADRVAKLWR